jgi:hypothetical protein
MIPTRVRGLVCALALTVLATAAPAAEIEATPVCGHCRSCCGRPCYDPCQPVGPVRRFLRKVFLPRCPAPCPPPCPGPVVLPPPVPAVFAPAVPAPPPANLDRPLPSVPPGPLAPPPVVAPFPSATSRSADAEPTPPPPPVRVDRIASFTRR